MRDPNISIPPELTDEDAEALARFADLLNSDPDSGELKELREKYADRPDISSMMETAMKLRLVLQDTTSEGPEGFYGHDEDTR